MEERTKPMVGLACAGGVVEGAVYEIGVICALEEAIEGLRFNQLDMYVGVSAGAVVASCLANGIAPADLARGIVGRAADPTLNLKFELLFAPAIREYGRRLQHLPQAVCNALMRYVRHPLDISPLGTLADLGSLVPVGFFDNESLHQHLAETFSVEGRTDRFDELPALLRVIAMDLDSAELAAFGSGDLADVPISKAVQASTALPVLYCPVEINGHHYIDGVARRTVNASVALEAGADLLFCINPIVPVDTTMQAARRSLVAYGLPTVLSQTFRSIISSRMLTGFRSYAHLYPDADIVLIEPCPQDTDRIFSNIFSYDNRRAVCEHAYQTTREILQRQAASLIPKLARHGLRLRTEVLDDARRTLYGRGPGALHEGNDAFMEAADVLGRLDNVLGRLEQDLV